MTDEETPDHGSASIPTLVDQLDAPDPQRRRAASVALSERVEDVPDSLDGVLDSLVPFLASDDPTVRMQVAAALAMYVHATPEEGPEVAAAAAERLDDESVLVRKHALSILRDTARVDPGVVEPAVGDVVGLLDSDVAAVRQRAVAVLLLVGREAPERLLGHEDALIARLDERHDDPTEFEGYEPPLAMRGGKREQDPIQRIQADERLRVDAIREGVAVILVTLAATDPARFEGKTRSLLPYADDDRQVVRKSVTEVLGLAGEAGVVDPGAVTPELVERLEDDPSDVVRGRAAWALATVADGDDAARSRAAEALASNLDLLEADDEEIRIGATALSALVAESRPEVVADARETFEAMLDHDSETVSQRAAYVLDVLDS